jgi:hypothetical protein
VESPSKSGRFNNQGGRPPRRVGECDRDTLAERVGVGELERRQDAFKMPTTAIVGLS